ncbi:MAG: hypothetical protein LJI21_00830 [Wolbachia endosymbiont of Menacanthus eurysternus]|nr:MAG: hypothetical protein LJI21_00830 [Wolbachia endosymbiont of Menacanthus eurysternus]
MRKTYTYILYYIAIFLVSFLLIYSGFWYFSAYKIKNLLKEIIHVNDKKFSILHDFSGFPFNLIFHIKNPKFSDKQLTISLETLTIKNKLFNKSIYVSIPNNEIDIAIHYNNKKKDVKCYTNNNNHFIFKLNISPFLINFNKNNDVIMIHHIINTFRYEDYGLKCISNSKDQHYIVTETNDKSSNNYIEFYINEKLNKTKLGFNLLIYKYKDTLNLKNHLNIDIKFNYDFMNHISASKAHFNIEKFLIQGNNFSLIANGKIRNYNLVTSSFEDEIKLIILNYEELISFIINKEKYPKISNILKKLIFSLSEKITNKNVQFSIKYNNNIRSSFIGKLSATDFMNQLNQITELIKTNNKTNKQISTS